MTNFKKFLGVILACVLCVSVLAACGSDEAETTQINEAVPLGGTDVVMTVDGTEVTVDEYRYFVTMTAMNTAYTDSSFTGDLTAFDWDKIAETVKDQAKQTLVSRVLVTKLGKENGVTTNADEWSQLEASMEEFKAQNGEELFNATLNTMGVSSVEGYKKVYELESLYNLIKEDFAANKDKYIEDENVLASYRSDETVSAQHILIMNDSEKHAEPKNVIESVLERARSGEDFNALMTEFNEDPGQTAAGYTFGKGEMVPEFETAAFALDYNEISDVVESSYGYHIIKRVVGLAEFEQYLAENAGEVVENTEVTDKISLKDIITEMNEANTKLNALQGGE